MGGLTILGIIQLDDVAVLHILVYFEQRMEASWANFRLILL